MVDIHALRPLKGHPVYSAAKAGLAMLTRSLARELGPEIRVNGIAPGPVLWPEGDMDEALKHEIIGKTALKRHGTPQDIAPHRAVPGEGCAVYHGPDHRGGRRPQHLGLQRMQLTGFSSAAVRVAPPVQILRRALEHHADIARTANGAGLAQGNAHPAHGELLQNEHGDVFGQRFDQMKAESSTKASTRFATPL